MNPEQRRAWRRYVFGCTELTPTQRLILLALEGFADWPEGTNARPGVARLADMCRMDERSVKRALHRGRELKLITQTARANPRRGWAATHRLVAQPDSRCPVSHLESDFKVTLGTVQGDRNDVSRGLHSPPTYSDLSKGTGGATAPPTPAPSLPDEEPRRYCPKHNGPTEKRCHDCGVQGEIFKAWKAAQGEARREARKNCRLCGGYLYLLGDDGTPVEPPVFCPVCKPAQARAG